MFTGFGIFVFCILIFTLLRRVPLLSEGVEIFNYQAEGTLLREADEAAPVGGKVERPASLIRTGGHTRKHTHTLLPVFAPRNAQNLEQLRERLQVMDLCEKMGNTL